MQDLFTSGRVIDLILALVAVEVAGLALLGRLTARVPPLRMLLPNLLAGAFLLLAVRAALVQAAWQWVAACLTAALIAHVADLTSRLPSRGPGPSR
ncbi:hypothetical protein [Rhodoplanes roseus]|uniref:Uncharacterized protein n=1 Tax=Rhodoplanes roseus TaxID=29409 RepID=A0A327L498_9BRAD|nr:hypothetical protein [Rhodoplanes roseus]RAI45216.1 hypothetical protein CH341_05095 [Rhodoplanes roseus]